MKKRNLSILLSLVMAAAIAGCGSSSTASSADSKAESSSAEEASSAAASASSVSGESVGSSSVSSTSGNDTATATAGAITSDNYTPGTTQDAGEAAGKNITFIIKNTTAPFFISMKEGAEQAGKDYGVTVSVQADGMIQRFCLAEHLGMSAGSSLIEKDPLRDLGFVFVLPG